METTDNDVFIFIFEKKPLPEWRDAKAKWSKVQMQRCTDLFFDLQNKIAMCKCV